MTNDRLLRKGVDFGTPNVARMWDYYLGGKDNFAVDRAAADAVSEAMRKAHAPDGRAVAIENRAFLRRAVRYLAEAGIRQFIDLGSGLPTLGHVHDIAREVAPDARVVYADYDPMVITHGRALLSRMDRTAVIQVDLRDPDWVLGHPELKNFIDLKQPVAVVFAATLHLLSDDEDPFSIVAHLRDALAPGSYLAITHLTRQRHKGAASILTNEFRRLRVTTPIVPRSREEIAAFFEGWEPVAPGVVFPPLWRPELSMEVLHEEELAELGYLTPDASGSAELGAQWMYVGLGRKV